ncbi:serine/threonine-protein phosphatase 6 regulatory ankyrin repeat subunit B-like [Haliotis rubra]|uniref:serine/threonine-protein phosphatase 6 regulatory ankyrin repeat subunit B-like n=1 Tax=Haliotis rubra TaxID=36100 RepID=UPI001EE54D6F|nr:serine/threonine-protein phosphatase 6 regulatory ankyrin repeat subunit B-like [Haliotis rubra]
MSKGQVDIDSREEEYGLTPVMLAARGGHRGVFEILVGKRCNMSLLDNKDNNILHMACYGGQIAIVKRVLSLDIVDINSRGHIGSTCVMVAAHRGKIDLLKYLVSKGGDVSLLEKAGDNILHIACRGGNVEMVKYIISQDIVDVNSKGRDARTVGMVAAHLGYTNIFDLCACAGCNLSAVDAQGNNVLHVAILGGHIRMVKHIFAQRIVNINSRGMNGKTPLMFAAFEGHRKVFDLVMSEGGNASLVDKNDDNILHWVCRGGHAEMVKYVISLNFVDINSRGHYGRTPMMVAAANGHRRVFDLVMSKGGDASLVDKNDDNILHWVCRGGHVEMVKYVISLNFVDINSRGHYGRTPMMVAAANGHRRVFDLVMSKGGDASLVDKNDDNILHWVCRGGHVEMVKYVISLNFVDINSRGHYGRTPMMVAAFKGHREVFDLVMSKGGDASLVDKNDDNILHWVCRGGHVEMVKYVISLNFVDINSRGHYGRTPMMVAAFKGHREVFDLILSEGGDASLVDKSGDNTLHFVIRGEHVEMVKYVISLNFVDINSRGHYGRTPMMVAAANGHRRVFDLVMSKGGDASLVDKNGHNILHLASWKGHVMMVKHILSKTFVDVNAKDKYGATAAMIVKRTKHKAIVSWRHPRSKHWHELDFVITRRSMLNHVLVTRTYHSANCDSDHSLVSSKVRLRPRRFQRSMQKGRPRIDTARTLMPELRECFAQAINEALEDCPYRECYGAIGVHPRHHVQDCLRHLREKSKEERGLFRGWDRGDGACHHRQESRAPRVLKTALRVNTSCL